MYIIVVLIQSSRTRVSSGSHASPGADLILEGGTVGSVKERLFTAFGGV